MDSAVLGETWIEARDFARLLESERLQLRERLRCPACKAPAYFMRAAVNGRAACFGARPHGEGCNLASESGSDAIGSLEDAESLLADENEIRLRAVSVPPPTHVTESEATISEGQARGFRRNGSEPGGSAIPTIALRVVLRKLLREPEFRESARRIRTPDGYVGTGTVVETVKNFAEATMADVDTKRLWWGTIYYPNVVSDADGRRAWLRSPVKGAPAVLLADELLQTILDRLRLADPEDLAGASFIWWGQLRKSRSSDALFLLPKVADADWIDFRSADADPS